jgi:nucleotide-binding universal stress UspA family protein
MTQRIVVGVDGSPGAGAALRFAVDEATLRNARLDAVLAWGLLDQPDLPAAEFDPNFGETEARASLERIVRRAVGDDPGVKISLLAINDLPARALLDLSATSDLLVVGARGLGGFRGLLLGSVSQQIVHHAACPVVVVPRPHD